MWKYIIPYRGQEEVNLDSFVWQPYRLSKTSLAIIWFNTMLGAYMFSF